jgi:hypothetical protein
MSWLLFYKSGLPFGFYGQGPFGTRVSRPMGSIPLQFLSSSLDRASLQTGGLPSAACSHPLP